MPHPPAYYIFGAKGLIDCCQVFQNVVQIVFVYLPAESFVDLAESVIDVIDVCIK
jgi:hypothetical protein